MLTGDAKSLSAFSGGTYDGIMQMRGAPTASGVAGSQTTHDSASIVINTANLGASQDLKIAFVGGSTALSAHVTDVSLQVTAEGVLVVNQDFTSAAAAQTWFTDNPLDLGSVASLDFGQNLGVVVSLNITTNSAGPAFGGSVVLATVPNGMASFRPPEIDQMGLMQGHYVMNHFG